LAIAANLSKGNPVNIPEPDCRTISGNATELEDVGKSPEKSYLFFLTARYLEIRLPGAKVSGLGKHITWCVRSTLDDP
jgi:hypothetical protein